MSHRHGHHKPRRISDDVLALLTACVIAIALFLGALVYEFHNETLWRAKETPPPVVTEPAPEQPDPPINGDPGPAPGR